jgi:hypothetical protein
VIAVFKKKRKPLDPLTLDPLAEQASITPQDNLPGPSAPDLEGIAHGQARSGGLVGRDGIAIGNGANSTRDPKSDVPLVKPRSEPKDD